MLVLAAAALAAVPLVALAILAATGAVALAPALAAMAATMLAAFALAALAGRDLARLRAALHRPGGVAGSAGVGPSPRLPSLAALAREIELSARALAGRAARSERRLEVDAAILQHLPDPLIVLGADRSVRRANAAARQAFGAELQAVLRHPTLLAAIDHAAASGIPERAGLALPVPVPREVDATVIPLPRSRPTTAAPPDAVGDGSGDLLVVLGDRTRERAIERMRADFVANVSHELRTPLASLSGFIDTLRGPAADDPEAQQRFLGIMAEQAARMNRLIDDLLSLSRIELVEHQPPTERVDLGALINRVAAGFEPRLTERQLTLEVSLAPGLPVVRGDADQLEQVLQNLLDNAVKYGGGTVRLSAAPAGIGRWPAGPGIVVAVADEGKGIPREHLPRLTERFYRVDQGRSRRAGGTGLGLAIVKHIVNRHRGHFSIESEEGRGATFSVWLPAEG
jgi:two-component system, OmpR family, phosphate regulon sensor histidine kinase PhoR